MAYTVVSFWRFSDGCDQKSVETTFSLSGPNYIIYVFCNQWVKCSELWDRHQSEQFLKRVPTFYAEWSSNQLSPSLTSLHSDDDFPLRVSKVRAALENMLPDQSHSPQLSWEEEDKKGSLAVRVHRHKLVIPFFHEVTFLHLQPVTIWRHLGCGGRWLIISLMK